MPTATEYIKDLVWASGNSAMCLVHQVEAELLYHCIFQTYLCKITWNCSVIETKNIAVDSHGGALSCCRCKEFASFYFDLPKGSCFFSCLSSQVTACHVTKLI